MKKIRVEFSSGESRYTIDSQGVNYMLAKAINKEEEEIELYAEIDIEGSPFEQDFSRAYQLLKDEIITQALRYGINPQNLFFCCEKMEVKELRALSHMTQKQFSEYFGIPKRTIEDWECSKRTPPKYVVDLIEYKLRKENLI